ncbi:MAG: WYL domain-containing protein [Gallionellaceae bacterium]|nr:WYL domain-containing protein [Gallionellaceae bacterium]
MATLDNPILALLPTSRSSNPWMSTTQIAERLKAAGQEVNHKKTVMRRLQELESQHLVLCEQRGKAYYWQRKEGASGLASGKMSLEEALALQILKQFAKNQLPEQVLGYLKGLLDAADERLKNPYSEEDRRYAQWHRKIAVSAGHFQLMPPTIKNEVFDRITDALFMERLLSVRHKKVNDEAPNERILMPLGLVEVANGLTYLVARMRRDDGSFYDNQRFYRLDRISSARLLDDNFRYPRDFNLDAYIHEQREMEFYPGESIKVTLKMSTNAYTVYLSETPLTRDQDVTHHKDGNVTVTATVVESWRFHEWLLARAGEMMVVSPKKLRDKVKGDLERAVQLYQYKVADLKTNTKI